MTLESVSKELERLENDLNYYENRLEEIKSLVRPQSINPDKIIVDGGKHINNLLKYVELENKEQLEVTILYIKSKIKDLNLWKYQEIDRLAKFGETIKAVVFLREKEFITDNNGKKRHLYWQEIGDKVYCDERTARRWYKLAVQERKKNI